MNKPINPTNNIQPKNYRNNGYFFYHENRKLKTIRQACAFDFDKLERAGLSDAEAFQAFSKVVYGSHLVLYENIISLEGSITLLESELPTYNAMRWWQEGVEILRKYKLLGIMKADIEFGRFLADLQYGPDNI